MRIFLFTILMTFFNQAAASESEVERKVIALERCGGSIMLEADTEQTLVQVTDVARCPYIVFNGSRRSMEMNEQGRYSDVYVWREDAGSEKLGIVVHNASGELRDELTIAPLRALSLQSSTAPHLIGSR